jgi:hypothetical protein
MLVLRADSLEWRGLMGFVRKNTPHDQWPLSDAYSSAWEIPLSCDLSEGARQAVIALRALWSDFTAVRSQGSRGPASAHVQLAEASTADKGISWCSCQKGLFAPSCQEYNESRGEQCKRRRQWYRLDVVDTQSAGNREPVPVGGCAVQ